MGFCRVAKAAEFLVIAGNGMDHINLAKKALITPGHSHTVFDYSPTSYALKVEAVSAENLTFTLHTAFTIGPAGDDQDSLSNNAKLLAPHRLQSEYVRELVQGIIEEGIRVLAALMSMEDIYEEIEEFKRQLVERIQLEVSQFGLRVYNTNIEMPVMSGDVKINVVADPERLRKKRRLVWESAENFGDEINAELGTKRHEFEPQMAVTI